MPVRKYRSAREIPAPPVRRPLDPDNIRIACELSETARALHPGRLEPGIEKFRSAREGEARPVRGRSLADDDARTEQLDERSRG